MFLNDEDGVFDESHFNKVYDCLENKEWYKKPSKTNDASTQVESIKVVVNGTTNEALELIGRHNQVSPFSKIEVLDIKDGELKTDKPIEAQFDFNGEVLKIKNFISHKIYTLFQRQNKLDLFELNNPLSMIEYVLIDTNYNGSDFVIQISDKPAKKTQMVSGAYTIPQDYTKIAIKIVSVCGEENLFVI